MLIDNWKTSWKLWSVLASVALGLFNAAVAADFWGLLGKLGPGGAAAITSVVTIVVIPLLRMLKQQADEKAPEQPKDPQSGFARPVLLLALAAALLVACAGVPSPKTFEDNVAATVVSVTQTRKAAELLLVAGKISKADAQNVQQQADNAREAVNVALAIRATDPAAAQTKLEATIKVLQLLDSYLATKGAKP